MPIELISAGPPTLIQQNVEYSLPSVKCQLSAEGVVQFSATPTSSGGSYSNLSGSNVEPGVEVTGGFIKCTTGNINVVVKKYALDKSISSTSAPVVLSYPQQVIADGASHYYRLADVVGPGPVSTPVIDELGTANGWCSNLNGITSGQPGAIAGNASMVFTSGGNIPIPIITPVHFTVEAWVYRTGPGAGVSRIYHGGNNDVNIGPISSNFALWIGLNFTDATGTGWLDTGFVIPATEWCYVVCTWDGTWIRAYVNGTQIYSNNTYAGKVLAVGTPPYCIIGSDQGCLEGRMDEVAIYPTALTATQIAAHYAARL